MSVHDNASEVIDKSGSVPNGQSASWCEIWLYLHLHLSSLIFHFMSLWNTTFFTARLTINVLDVNDNAPRFRPFGVSNFTEKILEGAQPGTTLLSVSAVDPDKGPNGQVIYQLLHLPRGGYVRLEDPSTGMTLCASVLLPSALTGLVFYATREAWVARCWAEQHPNPAKCNLSIL